MEGGARGHCDGIMFFFFSLDISVLFFCFLGLGEEYTHEYCYSDKITNTWVCFLAWRVCVIFLVSVLIVIYR